jgi:16S rRNA (uracil1498-N3)-methyltransferase
VSSPRLRLNCRSGFTLRFPGPRRLTPPRSIRTRLSSARPPPKNSALPSFRASAILPAIRIHRVNLLLFTPAEAAAPLRRTDPRAVHLLDVLRRQIGDTFDAGLINGPRGKGTLAAVSDAALTLTFVWNAQPPPPLDPITLLIGLPRPQTARKILQEATALGVSALHFFASDRGEPSYAQSTLWSSGEWRRHLITGAEQAFCTRLPEVTWTTLLPDLIAALPPTVSRIALDNYESPAPLSAAQLSPTSATAPITLAIGSERGWSPAERDLLRANNFTLAHLGARVLRAETAVTAAVAIVKARLGLM